MVASDEIEIQTPGRGFTELTRQLESIVSGSRVEIGLCSVSIRHTSASLVLCENADSDVLHDLERFMQRLVPDGDTLFRHDAEGADDMPAHVRSVLTQSDLTIPVRRSSLVLGTWQGIYLWEHRTRPHRRVVVVTIVGDG
ncbi:MAG: secondary thiamine-phosphate synthase enzyme YjbQ [Pseudomonadota bacterium]|nr:secondary thiamine-phosphate synthase enzyme YjbQ [Pseudomonadota bacterium]